MDHHLNIGVVGVGHLGALHAKMLAELDDVTLAGVFDTNTAKAESVAAEFGTKACSTYAELVGAVDALTIATTTSTHFEVARTALAHSKHVFIEKPITQTTAEADELNRLARDKRALIQVGHIERFNAAVLALEKYNIDPLFVESHRLAQFNPRGTDVAVVLDLMIHDIDIILSFVKSPVVRIEANGVAVVSDSVDIANARIQFESGCVANVTASRISQRKMRKMRLFQKDAYLSIDFSEKQAEVFRLVGDDEPRAKGAMMLGQIESAKHKRNIVYELPKVDDVNALKYELELFAKAIRTNTPPPVTGEDGRRALEVAHIIMEKISQQTLRM
ncbi:MAG: Gfo/Idh/MocA family oxidoreductase [Bacteroidetes bacterium]|nr:Gfo/Idh/MocA family oxidoreductase [Bacteroidota bacterium]MCW5895001.1 Gfo/Idh/MocA family oxidoreductase [Bacteroidota bacterium]